MIKKPFRPQKGGLQVNESKVGEPLESMIARKLANKEKIDGDAPPIFTMKDEGVQAGYNIRTDRFELAVSAMDTIEASKIAKSDSNPSLSIETDEDEPNADLDKSA